MRLKEREVTDPDTQNEILKRCKVCRIAMQDENGLYIVPLSYGYTYGEDKLTLYFHCAKDGRKVRAFAANPNVAFEMDCNMEIISGETACHYTCTYQSIIGRGTVRHLVGHRDKAAALDALMFHQTGRHYQFTEAMTSCAAVYQIDVSEFSVKQNVR